MNLDFKKVWASDTSPEYPTDNQTKRGLSFLGTEAPTFDLHDAIFQRLDLKDKWLYDQIRIACERFGQGVDDSVASAARDTMANAITNALLTQRKADEGGYGIVKMANAEQTQAGQDYNLAVSPKHLSEYVFSHLKWEEVKDKPQTSTRWPTWGEVKDKPSWGDAAWRGFFDTADAKSIPYDGSRASSLSCVASVRDYLKSLYDSLSLSLSKVAKTGDVNDTSGVLSKGKGGTGRGDGKIDTDTIYINSSGGIEGIIFPRSPGARIYDNKIVAGEDNGADMDRLANIAVHSWNGVSFGTVNDGNAVLLDCRTGDVRQRGDHILLGGGAHIKFPNSSAKISDSDNSTLSLGYGNIKVINKDGSVPLYFEQGVMKNGVVPIDHVWGAGNASKSSVYDADYGARLEDLPFNGERTVLSTGAAHNIMADLNDRLERSSSKKVEDLKTDILSKINDINSSFDDFGKVGSLVIAMRINGGQQINYPDVTDGNNLRPSACGEYGADMGSLPGVWKCLGASRWAEDPRGDASKITLYRRVR